MVYVHRIPTLINYHFPVSFIVSQLRQARMTTLVTNINQLVGVREETKILRGKELANLPSIANAYLIIEDGVIADYGKMQNPKSKIQNPKFEVDANGQFVLPAWCDSHTHLVFAASREEEFIDKIKGIAYAE